MHATPRAGRKPSATGVEPTANGGMWPNQFNRGHINEFTAPQSFAPLVLESPGTGERLDAHKEPNLFHGQVIEIAPQPAGTSVRLYRLPR
jgi:hypothetical protein